MAALPDSRGMPARVLMLRTHRNSYDHALRLAGAQIVDIGHNDRGAGAGVRGVEPWEIESAIDAQTAAFVFVAGASGGASLAAVAEVVHRHGLPLIVDAAAQLPPASNLRRFVAEGADLVVFSGGKAIGGPQASGLLIGRRALVGSALLQMMDMDVHPATWAPAALVDTGRLRGTPLHGIGRGFKVGKEEIAGLLCALERFAARDEAAQIDVWTQRLHAIADGLRGQPLLRAVLREAGPGGRAVPVLELQVGADGRPDPAAAAALCRRLQAQARPVHLAEDRLDEAVLAINPLALSPQDDAALVAGLVAALDATLGR
jgi:L-seryl-tRNA(Ser) seleniumtransferase